MKNLILIGGAMGVGKTTTGQILKRKLLNAVYLDGDWCWDADPFVVTDETKKMVIENITALLSNFLACSAYENVIFTWVMHEQAIIDDLLSRIKATNVRVFSFSLVSDRAHLINRLMSDVQAGIRKMDVIERSVLRLPLYEKLDTVKIDTTDRNAEETANEIIRKIFV